MMKGRLSRKLWAAVLAAAILLTAAPVAWAEDAPANERVYYTTFEGAELPDFWWGFYSTRAAAPEQSIDEGSSALYVNNLDSTNENKPFDYTVTGIYPSDSVVGFKEALQPNTSYVFSAMMKPLPYVDPATEREYAVNLATQLEIGTGNYFWGNHVSSENGWQRVLIPFTLGETIPASFQFEVQNGKALVNPDIPDGYFIEFVIDQIAIYKPNPVALTASSVENGATEVTASNITFSFNNVMDDTTVTKAANYMLTNNSISSVVNNGDGSYTATFANALTAGAEHTFTMSNIKDELGQDLAPVSITFTAAQETEPVDPPEPEVPGENTSVYHTNFEYECTVMAPQVWGYWGDYSQISISNDSSDGDGYAIQINGDRSYGFTGTCLYGEVAIYNALAPSTDYVLTAMMKVLPYNDGEKDYPVTLSPQIAYRLGQYAYSHQNISSEDGYTRVYIPFTTDAEYDNQTHRQQFYFEVPCADIALDDGSTASHVATFLLDDFELYQVAPVSMTETSIADGADDVSAAAEGITFSFNNGMDDTTVLDAGNYTLTDNTISGVVKNDDGSYTATFGSPLVENKTYTFGISGLKDELQQEMAADSITFTTIEAGAPQVLSTTPAYNAINVKTDTTMTVRFDSAVANVTKENVLANGTSENVSDVTMNGTNEAEITFAGLDYGTLYEVTLTGVTGTTGKVMDDYTTQFVTELEKHMVYENHFETPEDIVQPRWGEATLPIRSELTTEEVYAGNSSLFINPEKPIPSKWPQQESWFGTQNSVTMEAGKSYVMSMTVKSTSEENGGIDVMLPSDNGFIFQIAKAPTEWTTYTATYEFPAGCSSPGFFRLWNDTDSTPFYLDELLVYEAIPTQVLPNSDIVDGVQDVSVSGPYTLYFNNAIDTASLTGITINGTAVKVTGTTENTVTFTPAAALAYDSINTLAVNVKDASGADVAYNATFQTASVFTAGQLQLMAGQTVVEDGTLAPNTTYTATLSALTNNADTASDAVVLIALYDGGTMVAADFAEVTLDGGASIDAPLTAEITSPASFAGTPTLKAFLWNGFDNIAPIADYIAVTGAAQ